MSRTRTAFDPYPQFGATTQYHHGTEIGPSYSVQIAGKSSEMNDTVTPDFRNRIKRGEIINNGCSMTVSEQNISNAGHLVQTKGTDQYSLNGSGSITHWYMAHGYGPSVPAMPEPPDVIQQAKQYAVANLDSSPYDFLEDLGELGETLRFIKSPLSSLVRLGKLFRKDVLKLVRNSRTARGRNSTLTYAQAHAQVWLEYRFAVMPLIRSILEFLEALEDDDVYRPPRSTSRGHRDYDVSPGWSNITRYYGSSNNVYTVGQLRKGSVRSGILYSVSNPATSVAWKYGLRIRDIPATAWELLPLSFMVDRLVNIKNSVDGIVNLGNPDLEILAGWVVSKDTVETYVSLLSVNQPGWTSSLAPSDTVYSRTFTYKRDVWEPGLVDVIPALTLGGLFDSATKISDLAALGIKLFLPKG